MAVVAAVAVAVAVAVVVVVVVVRPELVEGAVVAAARLYSAHSPLKTYSITELPSGKACPFGWDESGDNVVDRKFSADVASVGWPRVGYSNTI